MARKRDTDQPGPKRRARKPKCEPAAEAAEEAPFEPEQPPGLEPAQDQAPEPMIVAMHARSEIGVPGPRRPPARLRRSEGVVLHCTAGRRPQEPSEVRTRLRRIHAAHVGGRGWTDWGYHWAVDPWGHVWQMCGWGVIGRHARTKPRSLNLRSHGIVLLGSGEELTEAEHAAVLALVDEHDRRYGPGFVIGHRDVAAKSCPGPEPYRRIIVPLGRPLGP